jgi:NAD(P)-dependent dehydrogenase (short-subunit alcohol dehydrogenase family)/uncharacterized protein YndB with AHSA1/START domain
MADPIRSPHSEIITRVEPVELSGRVVVVTGGGRGLGRAIAIRVAEAGARVAVVSRSGRELDETVDAISRGGGHAAAFRANVTDVPSVSETVAAIVRAFGPIDLLVNNAGTIGPIGPFSENDINDWWTAVAVNLGGAAIAMRAVLPSMLRRRSGRIVNVSSGGAATGMTYFSSYIVAKTALVRLTECVATEMKPYGVSVFAIGPGTVRTAMAEHSLTSEEGRQWLPWFQRIFDEEFDVPAQIPAALVAALATGRYDALSGRFITVTDDLDQLVRSSRQIQREELYTLRVNRLATTASTAAVSRSIADAATRPAGLTLRLERVLPLAIEDVFSAWIDPALIARWFVHNANVQWVREPQVDAKPGGGFRFCVGGEAGLFDFSGGYRELTSPTRLQFTWRWESIPIVEGPGDTSVTVDLEDSSGTRITLVQEHLPHAQALEAHRRGWERAFDGLASLAPIG